MYFILDLRVELSLTQAGTPVATEGLEYLAEEHPQCEGVLLLVERSRNALRRTFAHQSQLIDMNRHMYADRYGNNGLYKFGVGSKICYKYFRKMVYTVLGYKYNHRFERWEYVLDCKGEKELHHKWNVEEFMHRAWGRSSSKATD